jgi:hypothetical protein
MSSILQQINARQNGKSMLTGNSIQHIWLDEADDFFGKHEKSKTPSYIQFNYDPLVMVCYLTRTGRDLHDVISCLVNSPENLEDKLGVSASDEDREFAESIYNYFGKKHTLRRIKGEHISEWMLKVEDLCANRTKIDREHLKVLVTLPRIYKQNRNIESVMKEVETAPLKKYIEDFSSELEFIKMLEIKESNSNNYVDFFWKTPNKYLVRVRLEKDNPGVSSWNFMSKHKKILIKSKSANTVGVKGYNFNMITLNKILEVTPV